MENKNKCKCKANGCNKCPSFNYENEKEQIYCLKHKKDGMVNIKRRKNKCERIIIQRRSAEYDEVMKELLIKIKRDMKRKVCKKCNELGHDMRSNKCDENKIEKEKQKKEIIRLSTINNTKYEICDKLNISEDKFNKLKREVLPFLIMENVDVEKYCEESDKNKIECNECGKMISKNMSKEWKSMRICKKCICENHKQEINERWTEINEYKKVKCEICQNGQNTELKDMIVEKVCGYEFDHKNMFEKENNIYTMVNEGYEMDEIIKEIDKCQLLCKECHNIVTQIERKYGFIIMKIDLNKKLRKGQLTNEEYKTQKCVYQKTYEATMYEVYEKMKRYYWIA